MNKIKSLINRTKENFLKNKVATIVLISIWIICVVVTLFYYGNTLGKQSYGNNKSNRVVELVKGTQIKEIMPMDVETNSVAVKVATYARKNNGTFNIKVTGENTKDLYLSKDIDINGLQDNAFVVIDLDKKLSANDKNVEVVLSSNCEEGNCIGIYYYDELKMIEGGKLFINDNEYEGCDLTVRYLTDSEDLNLFYKIVIIFTIVGISLLVLLLLLAEIKPEVYISIMVLILGLSFMAIITPLSPPDETAHYEYSFQVSNCIMGEENHLLMDADYKDYGSYIGHMNVSSAYKKVLSRFNSKLVLDNEMREMGTDAFEIYFVTFIPQSLGITLARLCNLNRVKTFYLGRLFNLIFYTICIYIAIKKTPIHKTLFGIIATLPIFLQQASSYSYDCFINGLTFVLIAYLLKFIFVDEKIQIKEYIFIAIVCSLLAPAKTVYGFFAFLFWFVPTQRYKDKKTKIICTLILCAVPFYELFVMTKPIILRIFNNIVELFNTSYIDQSLNTISIGDDREKITVGQMIRDPLMTIDIFYRTIRYGIKNWLYDSMGRTLSGQSLILPTTLVHIMVIVPLVASFSKEKYVEPIGFKIVSLLLCVIIGFYILGGFLLSWTDMDQMVVDDFGGIVIQGIQGRYFCPLLPFAFSIFNNKKITIPQKYNKYIIFTHLLVVFEVIVYVLSYTFVN